jgi:hypothetical protein
MLVQAAACGMNQRDRTQKELSMTKFMLVYHCPPKDAATTNPSPEEMQKLMHKWQEWMARGMEQGWLVNRGNGLTPECRVVDTKNTVTDGPFMEVKEVIGGFSVVQAETIDAAAELAKNHPTLLSGGHVEIRALWDQS